jgi:hypothetical protein
MHILVGLAGLALILTILWDSFETMVLPRRVRRRVRLTRLFYTTAWKLWSASARHITHTDRREGFLSLYGPLSLILLVALWALSLVLGFAMLQWSVGPALNDPTGQATFGTDLYMSGTTFFTLGLGDVTPQTTLARTVAVAEAGTGFGFLAAVIGYLPIIYQMFSRRETSISLLDARAGSPPSAGELLRRHGESDTPEGLAQFLRDWERWAAELLESHISYPVLAYYRSQHDSQSWLTALTAILDVCALAIVGVDGADARPALLTFAIARHAAVDLSQIFGTPPHAPKADRLSPHDLARLRAVLREAGMPLRDGAEADRKLGELRGKYEPYVNALADYLFVALPPWLPPAEAADDWQTSVWEHATPTTAAPQMPRRHAAKRSSDGKGSGH